MPSATIVSYTAAAPPATPTRSRNSRRDQPLLSAIDHPPVLARLRTLPDSLARNALPVDNPGALDVAHHVGQHGAGLAADVRRGRDPVVLGGHGLDLAADRAAAERVLADAVDL